MVDYTWSFSSLKQYQNCPKQYHEIRVLKNYTVKENEAMIYGKEVHTAVENYVRDGVELAKNYQKFKGMVDELIAIPGEKLCELEMALTRDKKPCAFDDENRWVRGIADLVIIDEDYAFVVDYKTGSNKYPDTKQLKLMALMLFEHFPKVNKVKAGLMFLAKDSFITAQYKRADMEKHWGTFNKILTRLDASYEYDNWRPNPTPLCGWCSVKTCEFQRI
tara:strand:+ start:53 stop:709 length:657 start_codon:yes stop_codon:yes gene_type:complete